jgi:hypothetical protein
MNKLSSLLNTLRTAQSAAHKVLDAMDKAEDALYQELGKVIGEEAAEALKANRPRPREKIREALGREILVIEVGPGGGRKDKGR